MEEWTEENSGWAKPASVHSEPIKEEWGKTMKTTTQQQNGWTTNANAGWDDLGRNAVVRKKEMKWDDLEEEDKMHDNSVDGQKWGAKVEGTTTRSDDGPTIGFWDGGWGGDNDWANGGGGWSTGTILVVSGLIGANIGQDEVNKNI